MVKQKQKFPKDADKLKEFSFPSVKHKEVDFIIPYKSELKYVRVPHAESGHALS